MVLLTKYTIVHHITSNIAKFIQQSTDLFSLCFEIKCIKLYRSWEEYIL